MSAALDLEFPAVAITAKVIYCGYQPKLKYRTKNKKLLSLLVWNLALSRV